MGTGIGRNEPCPCGSGKKYKNCCSRTEAKGRIQNVSPNFRFEPGSYGAMGNYLPSIVCYKQVAPDKWDYHFIIVKLEDFLSNEDKAVQVAVRDLDNAFEMKDRYGRENIVGEYLRDQGYVSVENYKIADQH